LVPPVHLESPNNLNAFRLEVLAGIPAQSVLDDPIVARVRTMLPPQAEITRTTLTVPIHTVQDVQNVIRSVFRLNMSNTPNDDDDNDDDKNEKGYQKQRLAATFTALKSLNELSDGYLDAIQVQRQSHMDRTGVAFRVGQVVQHQQERWRGVIAKWDIRRGGGGGNPATRTSLTTKDYSDATTNTTNTTIAGNTGNQNVVYDIILDAGDAHGMGSSSGWSQAGASELQLVDDAALVRIHSTLLRDYFTRFSARDQRFLPNELVAYQFPVDVVNPNNNNNNNTISTTDAKLCLELIQAVQEFAGRLERCILDETSCPGDRGMVLLHKILERLQAVTKGDVFSRQERYQNKKDDSFSPLTTVAHHLHALLHLHLEVVDVNHQRKTCKEVKPKIHFSLGDVVRHKRFGFRGVVVTWDPKPAMDVRRWDGVQEIENPMEKPFYHVIPDPNDCIRVFGGERSTRYVCEDNLELCPKADRNISIDMEPVWTRTEDGDYKPPDEIKYRFGEDMEDDGITERCMTRIQDEYNSLYLLGRESTVRDPLASKLSLQKLIDFLQVVDTASDANPVQETIKEMRKAHVRRDLRWRLETGVSELLSGRGENAMEIYKMVVREDPTYAEAWNKLATCQYMYGKHEESMESTRKVLELDPNHLQAIIGLGLIHFENEEYQQAVKQFRRALEIDPWSPIGAKLSMTLDLLDKILIREEILD